MQEKDFGKTSKTVNVEPQLIDRIHRSGSVEKPDEMDAYPNQPLVLKGKSSSSALAMVSNDGFSLQLIDEEVNFSEIEGRNKEQMFLLNTLRDQDIRCVVVTGAAGTGKTTCIGGYMMEKVLEKNEYEKMILSKPLEIVTKTRYWGTVPGDEEEKFAPFLKSFKIMFESMAKGRKGYIEQAVANGDIEFMPLELMRGATLQQCLCWYDEAQNLNHHEVKTLGSRIDDDGQSKLILSGDLNQRDRNIDRHRTGIMKLVTSQEFKESSFTSHIHLVQNERGDVSQMFNDIFDG